MSNVPNTLELTSEQRQALDAHQGILQGDSFVILRRDVVLSFFGHDSLDELRQELQPAFDEAGRGELEDWDVDEFLTRMHQRHDVATEQ